MRQRHAVFQQLAAVLAAVAVFAGAVHAANPGVDVPPPLPAQPVVDTHWGMAVPDP